MRRQPTLTRTWRVSLNPRAHYNLSCGKDNRFSRCRQLHPDDVVSASLSSLLSASCAQVRSGVLGRQCPRHLPPRKLPTRARVASSCSDSPAYTRLRYRYTCVGTPGYTCALRYEARRHDPVEAVASALPQRVCTLVYSVSRKSEIGKWALAGDKIKCSMRDLLCIYIDM